MLNNTLPQLDPGTQLWLEKIEEATGKAKPCPVPQKYFDVLKNWGYVDGNPSSAKLSATGMGVRLLQKKDEAEAIKQAKSARKTTKKSRRK